MTVGELKEIINDVDDDRIIVMSIDPEGNAYHLLYDARCGMFNAGEVGIEELTVEAQDAGFTEADVMELGEKALILSL